MTHKIIKTENYLLVVDDSEVNINQYVYCDLGYIEKVMDIIDGWIYHTNTLGKNPIKHYKKIIAHLPLNNLPVLEGVDLLPPIEDEVDKLSEQEIPYIMDTLRWGFKKGYNKAKEKYKYTEEDLTRAFNIGINSQFESTELKLNKDESFDRHSKNLLKLIQSLQQPEMPFGFECEWTTKQMPEFHQDEPKTTTNLQGQTVLVGKYIY